MSVNENPDVERESGERSSNFPVFQSREEYIKALETWVNQARMWQNISSCFPYYLALNNSLQPNIPSSPTQQNIRNVQPQRNQFSRPSGKHCFTTKLSNNFLIFFSLQIWWKMKGMNL